MKNLVMGAIGALLLLAPAAHGALLLDLFNDGVSGGNWRRTANRIQVQERQGRLRFRSVTGGNGPRFSGYEARRWRFDYTRSHVISMQYKLDVSAGIGGNRFASVGARILPSGPVDAVHVVVRRNADGLFVVYESLQDGERIAFQRAPISATSGTLAIRYDADEDRLDISIDDTVALSIPEVLQDTDTGNGLARIDIGAMRRGPVQWAGWNRVWLDRFRVTGRIVIVS